MKEHIRKIQKTKTANYVFLPSDWIRKQNLKKGDFLMIRESENLTLTALKTEESK